MIYLILFFILLMILLAYCSIYPFLCSIVPRVLYDSLISYCWLLVFYIVFSHCSRYPYFSRNIILDFFLLIIILFYCAHSSAIYIALYSFCSVSPMIFVSSAYIYGYIDCSCMRDFIRSFVKILNSRHDILHPCPSPLPMCICSLSVYIYKLLNIIWTPCITLGCMFRSFIFWKRI